MLNFTKGYVTSDGFRGVYFPELNGLDKETLLAELDSLVKYSELPCYREIFTNSGLRFLASRQAGDTSRLESVLLDPEQNPAYPYIMKRFYRSGFWRDIGAKAIDGAGGDKDVSMGERYRQLELDFLNKAAEALREAPQKEKKDGKSIYNVSLLNPLFFV